jgi:Uma2 family endonuclease
MATTFEKATSFRYPVAPEQRIVLRDIDWATYQRLAEAKGDQPILLAYNRGVLEIMSPGPLHEDYKKLLGRFVESVTMELGIPCRSRGSMRWDRPEAERGLESDECYFLTAAKVVATRHRSNNPADYPSPDLAIEVDLSPSNVDRPEIYATIGVPEVWRIDGNAVRIDYLRDDGTYEPAAESRFLPVVPAEIAYWVLQADVDDESVWGRQLQEWVRATLLPRQRAAAAGPAMGGNASEDLGDRAEGGG